MSKVAVIDIGSNTIKLLIARRGAGNTLEALHQRTCESRISRGISGSTPRLGEEGMATGLEAIRSLLADCSSRGADRIQLVATSAVRSAANALDFRSRVMEATGHDLRVLSGEEEAALIGRGLLADPALQGLVNFYVFDLGGGSMECLVFEGRTMRSALSLPLGCVRLTEKFISDPDGPVSDEELDSITQHTRKLLSSSALAHDLPHAQAVFAGGSMTTARAIVGAASGKSLEETPLSLSLDTLTALLTRVASLPLAQRKGTIAGLSAARADVFPAALATMIETGRSVGVASFRHSLYNLRFGLAATMLGV